MPTRPFAELDAEVRRGWSPEIHAFAQAYGAQLDAELAAHRALGAELHAAREAAKLTQPALASLADVQEAEISLIERGLGNPTRNTLVRIAIALGQRLTIAPVAP